MKYRDIIFDASDVLWMSRGADLIAMRRTLVRYHKSLTHQEMEEFRYLERKYKAMAERHVMPADAAVTDLYREFLVWLGLPVSDWQTFRRTYRKEKSLVFRVNPEAKDGFEAMPEASSLFVAANDNRLALDRKLTQSGLGDMVRDVFSSEDLGVSMPDAAFFDACVRLLHAERYEILFVSADLTHLEAAKNGGLKTCWYNPNALRNTSGFQPDAQVASFRQLSGRLW